VIAHRFQGPLQITLICAWRLHFSELPPLPFKILSRGPRSLPPGADEQCRRSAPAGFRCRSPAKSVTAFYEKKEPFRSDPISANALEDVWSGSDTNL
jgi:hypothetical protein